MFYDLASTLLFAQTSVDEIIPGLWLGNYKSAIDLDFLKKNNIKFIVNCTPNTPFYNEIYSNQDLKELHKIDTYRIPVNDSLLERDFILMEQYFKIVIPILVKKYTQKKNILVHCHAGKQRSAIVVAALLKVLLDSQLITIENITTKYNKTQQHQFNKISEYLLQKRSQVFTYGLRINFEPTYKRFFKIK
jgi:protein tyrosine/serine phosphatase